MQQKKAITVTIYRDNESAKIKLYDCLLKWNESIDDVIQLALKAHPLPSLNYLEVLARNGKAIDLIKEKAKTMLDLNPQEVKEGHTAFTAGIMALQEKALGANLLTILIEEGFLSDEEMQTLEGLKIWARQVIEELSTEEENEALELFDARMTTSLNNLTKAIIESQKKRLKRAQ